ncbi:MAG: DNA-directed RNA polymerase subunit P [Thermoprotei archaeon]|nr:DNA-directed RNA polymerase subunit P [Thermoproteales archaeon]RLE76186.1 MAG: DNA-directed RNA polymerase subunit P [Thermoprotei archaeon]RLE85947.1 MAG: DNA-directed RNA polymerase subunit P [Thermoprotei archaeon]
MHLNSLDKESEVIYVCARCGMTFTQEEMRIHPELQRTHCPYCGYRIVYKKRPSIYKRIKAI